MSHDEPVIIDIDGADGGSESPATPTLSRLCRLSMFALQHDNTDISNYQRWVTA